MKNDNTITLDRPRAMRFDFAALIKLDEVGVNVFSEDFAGKFSPRVARALVWAGQLHTPKPLTLQQVEKYLPTDLPKLLLITSAAIKALNESLSKEDKKKPEGKSSGEENDDAGDTGN